MRELQACPPTVTVAPDAKLEPLTVTEVPGMPELGEIEVRVGPVFTPILTVAVALPTALIALTV